MRRVFIVAVALGLSACQPADPRTVGEMGREAAVDIATTTPREYLGQADDSALYKFCDEERAVYVSSTSTYYGTATSTAVVLDAKECSE